MPDSVVPRALRQVDKSRRSRWNGYEQPSLFEVSPEITPPVKLTPPQVELLIDIATHPQMYVGSFGRWGRTARALQARGLATLCGVERDYLEVVITEAGRTEAVRRGIAA